MFLDAKQSYHAFRERLSTQEKAGETESLSLASKKEVKHIK